MKQLRFYWNIVAILVLSLLIAGCELFDKEVGMPPPKLILFKTKSDYYKHVNILSGKRAPYYYSLKNGDIKVVSNDTVYCCSTKLTNGYIMDGTYNQSDYFTDITFGELAKYNEEHTENFPADSMFKRVIDKDPYLEFYLSKTIHTFEEIGAIDKADFVAKINELITSGKLEEYFDRIK